MLTTANLGLKKPEGTEPADIAIPNENMDILDAAVAAKAPIASPTFTGTVALPATTSIGTVTETELGYLDGVTSPLQTQINAKQATITGAATTIDTENLTVSRALVSDSSGKVAVSLVSSTELGYVDGVTSSIQTQLNAKALASDFTAHQTDYVRQPGYSASTGTANTYAVTLSPALSTYVDGVAVAVKINVANTGASTININGLGAKSILKANGNALASGNLKLNSIYTLRYNGTAFILQGEGGEYGDAVAADVLAPKTIGTDTGLVIGTIPVNTFAARGGDYNYPISTQTNGSGYLAVELATGYYLQEKNQYGLGSLIIQDPDFVANNIIGNIFGLQGTAQAAIYAMAATQKSTTSTAAVSLKSITVNVSGTFRISFDVMTNINSSAGYAQIYKNGSPVGTLQVSSMTGNQWTKYTQDLAGNASDIFQLYAYSQYSTYTTYVQNFEIKNAIGSPYNAVVNVN